MLNDEGWVSAVDEVQVPVWIGWICEIELAVDEASRDTAELAKD